jgi:glutamate/tyrosine decarboxylase-like PLP-dependent enzyme
MTDPLAEHQDLATVLELAAREATEYLAGVGEDPVLAAGAEAAIRLWADPLPETGVGSSAAVTELAERARAAATRSTGPRFFHFVMGGSTPAALAADWLTSAYDQVAYAWASSPMAARIEQVALDWLRQLFELPETFTGVFTTGATMANFVGLSAARNRWAERQGVDVEEQGLAGLPAPAILSSGYVHPSAVQAIGMLGLGRASVQRLAASETGRLDSAALRRALQARPDGGAIVIANAGEVNAGDFDPIEEMADLCQEFDAWLHVDGAFGLFARLAPVTRSLTAGVERANSITCDAHKWLNVPYDCGFSFVREAHRLPRALNVGAPYLPAPDDPHPNPGFLAPENSRRARALAVWATLRAYGRAGYREMVERHLGIAQHLAALVDASPDLERLAPVSLNIVCFRACPNEVAEGDLDDFNERLGNAIREDGRVFVGSTTYAGRTALRPAIVNWRTGPADVEALIDVTQELIGRALNRG